MAQIREIKKRIKSVQNTKKVTHAMELISAAKMRKAQIAALAGRPYTLGLDEITQVIKAKLENITHELLKSNDSQDQLIIIVTSDRGLAGGLNINLFREIIRLEAKNAKFVTVGKKGTLFAAKASNDLLASFTSEEKSTIDLARALTKLATESFISKQVSKISIVYPHFVSTVKQEPRWTQILPIELDQPHPPTIQPSSAKGGSSSGGNHPTNLLFEPNMDQILQNILPHYVLTKIYQILLEAKASEHSARMVAMKNATDSAGELIDDLTLIYNQVRQETITTELLDITTAQKAFE